MRFRDMFKQIDPRNIEIDPDHNVRDYEAEDNIAHLANLKSQIERDDVQQPLWVRETTDGRTLLIDGESRLRQIMQLIEDGVDIKLVPVKYFEVTDPVDIKFLSLTANTGKRLQPWEAGKAYRALEDWGVKREEIAKRAGVSLRYVNESIELCNLPPSVKAHLAAEWVTPARVLSELRKVDGTPEQKVEQAAPVIEAAVTEAKKQGSQGQATIGRANRLKQYDELLKNAWENGIITFDQGGEVILPKSLVEDILKIAGLIK